MCLFMLCALFLIYIFVCYNSRKCNIRFQYRFVCNCYRYSFVVVSVYAMCVVLYLDFHATDLQGILSFVCCVHIAIWLLFSVQYLISLRMHQLKKNGS